MIPRQLIQAAVAAALIAVASGQIPKFIQTMRIAQYKVFKESQAPNWGNAMILPVR